jgi:hypothetical protein
VSWSKSLCRVAPGSPGGGTADLAALVSRLDLPGKIRLLTGASAFTLHPEPAIGLDELRMPDGPTGVRGSKSVGTTVDSVLDEATLRELYLLPFEIAVADSHPWSIMAAYDDVNGLPATEQRPVNVGILKQVRGWGGLLMSDRPSRTSRCAWSAGPRSTSAAGSGWAPDQAVRSAASSSNAAVNVSQSAIVCWTDSVHSSSRPGVMNTPRLRL